MSNFILDDRLQDDTYNVADLKLCRILLMNDKRYAWAILVPRLNGLREFHDLTTDDRHLLMDEVSNLAQAMEIEFSAEKMNIGALGNIVPQLHIHIIARNSNDFAWPGPVWGVGSRINYTDEEGLAQCHRLKALIQKL